MNPVFETRVDYVDFEENYASVSLLFGGIVIYSVREVVLHEEDVDDLEQKLIEAVAKALKLQLIHSQRLGHIK